MKKKIIILIISSPYMVFGLGCHKTEEQAVAKEPKIINFYYPDGLPALTAAKLAKEIQIWVKI